MAIAIACPHCKQVNKLDDAQKGKEARCAHCGKGFVVKVKAAAPSASPEPPSTRQQVKAGPPPVRAVEVEETPRGKRAAVDNVEVVEAPLRRRRARDDDDRPARRQGSNAAVMAMLIIGGILVVGGGVAAAILFLPRDNAEPQEAIAQNPGQAKVAPPVDPLQGIRLQDVVIDPTRAEDFDIMMRLLASDEEALRRRAHEWLARANNTHPRRGEVAKLLEGRVQLYIGQQHGNEHFFDAYFAWATKDNFNWLINMAREKGPLNRRRGQALETLGKLKDERAIPEMVLMLDSFHDREAAFKALAEMGPAAEKSVLGLFHDPDSSTRDRASKLLQLYNTSQDKLLTQTLVDLNSIEERRVAHAVEWLTTAPVDEKRRGEVAKAIDRHLTPDARGFGRGHLMTVVQRWGTTDNLVRLTQMLADARLGAGDVIKALGAMRDPRAAQALAGRISNFFDGKDAQQALQGMGALAEPAVIPQLASQDRDLRLQAARLLAVIGTKASLQPLNNAGRAFLNDRDFGKEALAAIQAIQARQ